MNYHKLYEQWNKTITESRWDAVDILEAMVDEYGYTVNDAPNWMKYAASHMLGAGDTVILYAVWDEDTAEIFENDIFAEFKGSTKVNPIRHRFIKLAQQFIEHVSKTLDIENVGGPIKFLPITEAGIDILKQEQGFMNFFSQESKTFNVPTAYLPRVVEVYQNLFDAVEQDEIEDFLKQYNLYTAYNYYHDQDAFSYHNEDDWSHPIWDAQYGLTKIYDLIVQLIEIEIE